MEFEFNGNLVWHEELPISVGAWKVDYIVVEGVGVTPLNPKAAEMLNMPLPEGMSLLKTKRKKTFLVKHSQCSIFKKDK